MFSKQPVLDRFLGDEFTRSDLRRLQRHLRSIGEEEWVEHRVNELVMAEEEGMEEGEARRQAEDEWNTILLA